jgi:hypothetical protein
VWQNALDAPAIFIYYCEAVCWLNFKINRERACLAGSRAGMLTSQLEAEEIPWPLFYFISRWA